MLAYYPITVLLVSAGVLLFALLYKGGGANALIAGGGGASPAPGIVDGETSPSPSPTPTPTPTPTPEAVDSTGRLLPYLSNGLYGYKNTKGQVVIELKYLYAMEFGEGLYTFAATEESGRLLYGLISREGTYVMSPRYTNVRPFSDGYAAVELDEKWGYIDEKGVLVIDCAYREAYDFHDGRAAVRPNSTFGYIDPDGEMAIEPQFEKAGDFGSDMAFVTKDDKRYIINKIGTRITSLSKEDGEKYQEHYAVLHSSERGYCFFNESRSRVFSKFFEEARNFSDNLAAVKLNGKWGFIDKNGTEVVSARFIAVGDYANDRAAMQDETGKWGYIDRTGDIIIPCEYDVAGQFYLNVAVVKKGTVTGIVTKDGTFTELYSE